MAGVAEALVAQLLKEDTSAQNDPLYKYGAEFAQSGPALAQAAKLNPWESLLVNTLSGLGGGVIQGVSQRLAKPSTTSQALAALLMPEGTEREKAFSDPELLKYKTALDIEQRLKQQDAKEEEQAFTRKQELQQIADANSGKVTREVKKPDGSVIQQERFYDPMTKALGWRDYGQEPDIYKKKLMEALAEKEVGNVAYGGGFDPEKTASIEDALRKEVKGGVPTDQFLKGETAFKNMLKAYNDKSGLSDIPILMGSVQTTEPGLAVRQDDKSLIMGASGLGGVFAEAAAFIQSGRKFTPSMRAQLIKNAAGARNARLELLKQDVQNARAIAERRKVNADNVQPFPIPDMSEKLMEQTFGGELWQDENGKNWIIKKDADGNPYEREEL